MQPIAASKGVGYEGMQPIAAGRGVGGEGVQPIAAGTAEEWNVKVCSILQLALQSSGM